MHLILKICGEVCGVRLQKHWFKIYNGTNLKDRKQKND